MVVFLLIPLCVLFGSLVIFCSDKKRSAEKTDNAPQKSQMRSITKGVDPVQMAPTPDKEKESRVLLTKDVPIEERPKNDQPPSVHKPSLEAPENVPLGPPCKDPYDDTLRNVNSLQADLSQSVKKNNNKSAQGSVKNTPNE